MTGSGWTDLKVISLLTREKLCYTKFVASSAGEFVLREGEEGPDGKILTKKYVPEF